MYKKHVSLFKRDFIIYVTLKVGLSPSKKIVLFVSIKSFENDEKFC